MSIEPKTGPESLQAGRKKAATKMQRPRIWHIKSALGIDEMRPLSGMDSSLPGPAHGAREPGNDGTEHHSRCFIGISDKSTASRTDSLGAMRSFHPIHSPSPAPLCDTGQLCQSPTCNKPPRK